MATTSVTKVVVEELSKYGFKMNGRYVNYSKQLSESDKAKIVPGASFDAEVYVSDTGKEYLNKIVSKLDQVKEVIKSNKENKPAVQKFDNPMTREDWEAKDKRISRQGVIQAAVQATGGDFDEAVKLADKMLEFVNK